MIWHWWWIRSINGDGWTDHEMSWPTTRPAGRSWDQLRTDNGGKRVCLWSYMCCSKMVLLLSHCQLHSHDPSLQRLYFTSSCSCNSTVDPGLFSYTLAPWLSPILTFDGFPNYLQESITIYDDDDDELLVDDHRPPWQRWIEATIIVHKCM